MEIFVGKLPGKSDAGEICRLFEKHIRLKSPPAFLPKSRSEKRRSVTPPRYEVMEVAGEVPVRFGFVVLNPENLACQVMADLKGATLRGEAIFVREFVRRAYINDQRILDWRSRCWTANERRLAERRSGKIVQVSGF